MRSVRITVGIVAAVACAFGAFAGPAFAKKEKKAPVFGKFTASIPGGEISPEHPATATGIGAITELSLAGGALFVEGCLKESKSAGTVVSESSETFFQDVTYKKCIASVAIGKSGLTSKEKIPTFHLAMEFHSNHSAVIGEGEEENLKIVKPSSVSVKIGKTSCFVVIPAQTVPVKAEKKPNKEYEAAGYETELSPVKKKQLALFPSGFQEKLYIEWEFNKLESLVKPNASCTYEGGKLDTEPETPNFGYVVYNDGVFEGELEEISIRGGDLGFEPKP
jgi:hypothetical protein